MGLYTRQISSTERSNSQPERIVQVIARYVLMMEAEIGV
jgi:hypothetical protein